MIHMRPEQPDGVLMVAGFTAEGFVVAGRLFAPTLLITASHAFAPGPMTLADLGPDSLARFDIGGAWPPLLLLGTGQRMQRVPAAFSAALREKGIVVEAMDSRAAARTYNMLIGDSRPVAALLLG